MRDLSPGWVGAFLLALGAVAFAVVPPLIDSPGAAKTVVVRAKMVDTSPPAERPKPLALGTARPLPVVKARPQPVVTRPKKRKTPVKQPAAKTVRPVATPRPAPVIRTPARPRPTATPAPAATPTVTAKPKPKPKPTPAPTFDSTG